VLGPVTVSLTANDLGHTGGPPQTASDLVTITVVDTTAPTIIAPASVNAQTEPGQAGAHVSYSVTITDIEAATVACVPVSGSFFPIGSTTVTCTGVDSSGNSAALGFPVNVVDAEKPVLGPISDLVVPIAVHAVSGVVTFASPGATDNSGSVSVQCAPPSGSTMPLGVTTVVCTATDPSGNSASASFAVRVLSGGLPATGGDVSSLWIALAALCAGTALIVAGRRRRAA
jgi:LPXTG-motif cell wall-anchored protein